MAIDTSQHSHAAALYAVVLVAMALYFIPAVISVNREHPRRGLICLLNLCLGWTVGGWVVLLAWALSEGGGNAIDLEGRWPPGSTFRSAR